MTHYCHCCGVGFNISHYPDLNKLFLITSRHNNLCYGVVNLYRKALMPTHMHYDPLINPGRIVRSRNTFLVKSNPPNQPLGTTI